MVSRKTRKHSGWVYPKNLIKLPYKKIIEEGLEPEVMYDDWCNYRDGDRALFNDRTRFKSKNVIKLSNNFGIKDTNWSRNNKKLIKLLIRRRKSKLKRLLKNGIC